MLRGLATLPALGHTFSILAAPPSTLPIPQTEPLTFRIRRNDNDIGKHTVNFRQDGGSLQVSVAVDIVVKLGPIVIFRYVHRAGETWHDDVLIAANGKTDDDGVVKSMTARLGPEGLVVEGSAIARYIAPLGTMVANHWNCRELDRPMINPQGGKLLRPVVATYPEELVALASGRMVPARRFNLSGDAKLDLWYDRVGIWTAARFVADDGSVVLYERV